MTLLPLLQRELGAQARQPSTHWVRVAAVAALILVFGFVMSVGESSAAELGRKLFGALDLLAYYLIWILVPLLAADCLSHEKREGTLGLLFLTPLRAWEVATAKAAVHWLRGLSVFIAGVPILMMSFLLGGVTIRDVTATLLVLFGTFLLAAASGLLASSICRHSLAAILLAVLVSGFVSILFSVMLAVLFDCDTFWHLWPTEWITWTGAARFSVVVRAGALLLVAAGIAIAIVRHAAWQTAHFWQDTCPLPAEVAAALSRRLRLFVSSFAVPQLLLVGWGVWIEHGHAPFLFLHDLWTLVVLLLIPVAVINRLTVGGAHQPCLASSPHLTAPALPGSGATLLRPVLQWPWLAMVALLYYAPAVRLDDLDPAHLLMTALLDFPLVCLATGAGCIGYLRFGHGPGRLIVGVLLGVGFGLATILAQGWVVAHCLPTLTGRLLPEGGGEGLGLGSLFFTAAGATEYITAGYDLDVHVGSADELKTWGRATASICFGAFVLMTGAVLAVRRRLRRLASDPGLSSAQAGSSVMRDLAEPVIARAWVLRRAKRRLERSPPYWLLRRTWSSRADAWAWCLAIVVVECTITPRELTRETQGTLVVQYNVLALLAVAMAFAAARSFQHERRTGTLELILTTPLRTSQILGARWASLLAVFVPPLLLIALATGFILTFPWVLQRHAVLVAGGILVACTFVSIPLVGLYAALHVWSHLTAWLLTCLGELLLAGLLGLGAWVWLVPVLPHFAPMFSPTTPGTLAVFGGVVVLVHGIVAWALWRRLNRQLATRRLPLGY